MKKLSLLAAAITCLSFLAAAQTDSTTLKDYTGRYVFPDGSVVTDVTVLLDGEQLSMNSSAGTSPLEKLGVDSFSIVQFQGTAVFKRNEAQLVKAVHIEAAGYVLDGTKEEGNGWSFTAFRKPADIIKPR